MRFSLTFDEWMAVSRSANFVEFDWIGVDNQGHMGIFSSVSVGYIPPMVFTSYESYIVLENFLDECQKFTTAEIVTRESGQMDYWRDWAQKGFFAYDYQDIQRTIKLEKYDLVAKPAKPLFVGEVSELEAFADIIPKFNLEFIGDISFSQLIG